VETRRLVDELRRAWEGPVWHGPALGELLEDVTAGEAAAHPIPGVHSIWEIVLHATGWAREVERRLRGGEPALPAEGDWPEVPCAPTPEMWEEARGALADIHRRLQETIAGFPEERLREKIGTEFSASLGTGIPYRAMIQGLAQHDAYHGGQIAILKKALRSG
jgi:hypothetical protein